MYILKSVIHKTIWGGDRLSHCTKDNTDKIGHLYLFNGHEGLSNSVLNNDNNLTLRELFQKEKYNWKMQDYEEFPLTIALVDATDDLSIQVHPDDTTAESLEGSCIGKCESWYFLKAPQKGWIYAGCNYESIEEVRKAASSEQMENVAGRLPIEEGDYVCIHSGALHSMTAGCLTYEIEYGSDYTYRFYDFDRIDQNGNKRELHIQKALRSIKTDENPTKKKAEIGEWISEQNYEIMILGNDVQEYINHSDNIELLSVIEGAVVADGINVSAGMGIIILPGEKLSDIGRGKMIVARLKR